MERHVLVTGLGKAWQNLILAVWLPCARTSYGKWPEKRTEVFVKRHVFVSGQGKACRARIESGGSYSTEKGLDEFICISIRSLEGVNRNFVREL